MKFFFLGNIYMLAFTCLNSFDTWKNFFWEGKIFLSKSMDDERIGIFIYDVCGTRG